MSPQRRRLEVGGCEREQKMMCFITCVITVWSRPVEALKPPIRGSRSVMTPSGRQILLSSSLNTCAPHPPPSPSHLTLTCPLHDLTLRPSPSISPHYPFHADQPPPPSFVATAASCRPDPQSKLCSEDEDGKSFLSRETRSERSMFSDTKITACGVSAFMTFYTNIRIIHI